MILGTAGHIDHGKTALVKALTGIDTDRLAEEKRRGITLELGFAHLTLPDGRALGVVDVPGHEKFVKAMVAGAGGIDLALLVIALDEGVMPQTREHLDICRLLGVKSGVVVITKSDLLPELGEEWLELLREEITELVEGTFLEGKPIVPCSARTGEGIEDLKQAIAMVAGEVPQRPIEGPLFLPIDRAFSLKGFGTVVTGAMLSGSLSAEEEVSLLPGLPGPFRVRGIQTHGKSVPRATAGSRTAVNLAGLDAELVTRGMTLVRAGELPESRILDVQVFALPALEARLPKRKKVLVHLGTAQVPATLALFDSEGLAPGQWGIGQLRLGAPIAALAGQRFVLRGSRALAGRGATIAGGEVLSIAAPKRRRVDMLARRLHQTEPHSATTEVDLLLPTSQPEREAFVASELTDAHAAGRSLSELFARTAIPLKLLQKTLDALSTRGKIVLVDRERRLYVDKQVLLKLRARALETLTKFHADTPLESGMSLEALRTKLSPELDPRVFARVLALLSEKAGEELEPPAEVDREKVRLKGRGKTLTASESELRTRLIHELSVAGLAPPTVGELARLLALPPARVLDLLRSAQGEGRIQRASEELYFATEALEALKSRLVGHLVEHGSITTQQFKELVGQTRKFVIPLSEYFDREKVTLRVGEKRVLRRA